MPKPISVPASEGATPLLGPGDPAPVEVVNAAGEAPVLLVCDHASRRIPGALGKLGLDDALLMRHIGWDIGAAAVTQHLSARFKAPAVFAGYSRLVVDCNRDLGDPSCMPERSDGIDVPGNCALSDAARKSRADALYWPYHEAIAARLDAFAARGLFPAILAIHSFTPVMNGLVRPWHVGILWDKDGRIAVPLMANLRRNEDIVVGDNEPYSARVPAGYTVRAHALPGGLAHVAVEIRQDVIDTPAGAERWAQILGDALAPILGDPELFRAEHSS